MKSASDISELLMRKALLVAKHLFPAGKQKGNEFCIGSIKGEEGDSLKIRISGEKTGVWCDFADGGKSGDLLDLWMQRRNLSLPEAVSEASAWLGCSKIKFQTHTAKSFVRPIIKNIEPASRDSEVGNYLINKRLLTEKTLNDFKIAQKEKEIVFISERDNENIQVKYLSLDRPDNKKKMYVSKNCEPCLFGWQALSPGAREVTICEGEIDAMTLHQYGIPALSVPFGGGKGDKHQWLQYEFDRLAAYDKIYLCFDNDEEGKLAVNDLVERLGRHKCYIVTLPYKDANACLQAGMSDAEIKEYFAKAASLDPRELRLARLYCSDVKKEFYPDDELEHGIELPWEKAKGKVLLREDELSVWLGINGHGKSQAIGQVILETLKQREKVCIASLELKPKRLLMRLTRQASALKNPATEFIDSIHEWYGENLWVFDLVGNAKSDRLLEVFRYARQRYGIKFFVIDSLMKLDIAEDDYKAQKSFIEKLCDFKNEFNCHVHLIVHPRKGLDELRAPGKLDVKGTGAITDLADNCFTIWRNKSKENEIQSLESKGIPIPNEISDKVDALLTCDKQRNGEWEGKIALWFHKNSFQFLSHPSQKPIRYVNYSSSFSPKL